MLKHFRLLSLLGKDLVESKDFIIISLTINISERDLVFNKIGCEALRCGWIIRLIHLVAYF